MYMSLEEGLTRRVKNPLFLENNLPVCLCLGALGVLRDQTDKR